MPKQAGRGLGLRLQKPKEKADNLLGARVDQLMQMTDPGAAPEVLP
jgi:hypothetical protein